MNNNNEVDSYKFIYVNHEYFQKFFNIYIIYILKKSFKNNIKNCKTTIFEL